MKNKQYKVIVLGDIHGTIKWKKVIEQNKDADKIVFLGDYFDSFTIPFEEQYSNFKEILKYKKENLSKVVLLLGNHEYHYLSAYSADRYSGHQLHYAGKIEEVLEKAIKEELINIAYAHREYLFTHAGVTKEWLENQDSEIKELWVSETINRIFLKHPEKFKFTPSTGLDNYGDSITQGPLWVRPRALKSNMIEGVKQIVGHTIQKNINLDDEVIFIDTLEFGNEYLVINNGILEIGKIK